MKHIILLCISFLFFTTGCKKVADDQSVTTIYLVRHAEKTKQKNDPGLTPEGKERAYFLADYLKDIPLDAIYSTDYFRTRKTVQPTVSAQNVKMQLYDASDLEAFAANLKSQHKNQKVLVVGHSNTTAHLSNLLLGEEKFAEIPETDYDNLYVITLGKNPSGINLKYGQQIGKNKIKGRKKDMVK